MIFLGVSASTGAGLSDGSFSALIAEAEKYIGYPYVWGGSTPSMSFDCSGYICWIFTQSGTYNLPRTTAQGIYNQCTPISQSEAQPGDLIFFTGTYSSSSPVTHIVILSILLYVSAIFDCYDLGVLGLAMADHMKAELCVDTVRNAWKAFPAIRGAVLHSDRGSQYTSACYRAELARTGIIQSMNSDGGRCHDNARCEAMWARMKEELLYGRDETKKMKIEELKTLIWRYFIIYWNTRRICSANGGLPPMLKRKQYYESLEQAA